MNQVLARYTVNSQKGSLGTKKVLRKLNFYVLDTGFMIQDPKGNKRIADVFIEYGKVMSFEQKEKRTMHEGGSYSSFECLLEIAYIDHNGWKKTLLFEMRGSGGLITTNQRACRQMKTLIESRGIPSLFMKGTNSLQNQTAQNRPAANPHIPMHGAAPAVNPVNFVRPTAQAQNRSTSVGGSGDSFLFARPSLPS